MFRNIFQVVVYLFAAAGFVLIAGYAAVRLGITDTTGIIDTQREAFLQGGAVGLSGSQPLPAWTETEEWKVLEAAIRKDVPAITRAAQDSDIPARLIVANLITEQLRLFFTDRENYKQFFYPLKILGSQTQFSWGIMGMKEDTAIKVEQYLKDPSSPYYPGAAYEHLLDSPATTTNVTLDRFTRMTDQHNHYWSYVYAGLFLKEIETQWANAGFPISENEAVLSTLFNIGFAHSNPNAAPNVGGAELDINGTVYSFGDLAGTFYDSDLLIDLFPR
ncbi:MAG: hypothetical protein WAV21_02030 [Minisyncoccia bacterium]